MKRRATANIAAELRVVEHAPVVPAVLRKVCPTHIAVEQHQIAIQWRDGRCEHRTTTTKSDRLPLGLRGFATSRHGCRMTDCCENQECHPKWKANHAPSHVKEDTCLCGHSKSETRRPKKSEGRRSKAERSPKAEIRIASRLRDRGAVHLPSVEAWLIQEHKDIENNSFRVFRVFRDCPRLAVSLARLRSTFGFRPSFGLRPSGFGLWLLPHSYLSAI